VPRSSPLTSSCREPPVSLSDLNRRTDILLQNEPDWTLGRTCCFITTHRLCDRGMPRKVELRPRLKMRTRHVFAGSFFGRTKVVSPN